MRMIAVKKENKKWQSHLRRTDMHLNIEPQQLRKKKNDAKFSRKIF